jgi:chemotaxis protein MotA
VRFLIGITIIFASVIGGYIAQGGHLIVLLQPFEALIIIGAAFGAFIIGNTGPVLKQSMKVFGTLFRGPHYDKKAYVDLLGLQFTLFKLVKSRGVLALEEHIERPAESKLFQGFPSVAKNGRALEFLCDYLRILTLGTRSTHEMEALMDEELEVHEQENHRLVTAIQALADGTPALGIVAAVLGVIHTMGSISEPPEVLGHMIGGALVGTFLGVFCAYGFFGPMAQALRNTYEADAKYLIAMKIGMLAHIAGNPPAIAIEFARKSLMTEVRPTFLEVDEATADWQLAA